MIKASALLFLFDSLIFSVESKVTNQRLYLTSIEIQLTTYFQLSNNAQFIDDKSSLIVQSIDTKLSNKRTVIEIDAVDK